MRTNYELKCFLHVPISIGEANIVRHKSKNWFFLIHIDMFNHICTILMRRRVLGGGEFMAITLQQNCPPRYIYFQRNQLKSFLFRKTQHQLSGTIKNGCMISTSSISMTMSIRSTSSVLLLDYFDNVRDRVGEPDVVVQMSSRTRRSN